MCLLTLVAGSEPGHRPHGGWSWSRGMAEYRVYKIRNDRVAEPPTAIEADTDATAIEQAKQYVEGCDVELWQGVRFVIGLKGGGGK
jgi:hypothetical protein